MDSVFTDIQYCAMMMSCMYNIYFFEKIQNRRHKLSLLGMIMEVNTRKMVNVCKNQDIE